MRVLVICDQNGVSEFYRVATPYQFLADAGHIELTQNDGYNPAIIDHLSDFNTVVFSRVDSPEHSLILLHAKMQGVRVVFDVDDNLLLLPPSIGVFGAWHQPGTGKIMPRLYYFKKNIRLADILTVSTDTLGRQLCNGEPHSLRPQNDYIVLPNQILASDWVDRETPPELKKPEEQIWVGWWGIYNHWDDWRDIAPYIEPVIASRPNVRLVILGMPELACLFPTLREQNQLMVGPFVPTDELDQYRDLVKLFDIALAPTSPCPFNEAKSDLKMLQYGAAGVPVIASSTTYADWRQFATIIENLNLWGMALDYALDNLEAVRLDAIRLQHEVLTHRTYEINYHSWLEPLGLCQKKK